jgi:SAM-dependent methyltransferase
MSEMWDSVAANWEREAEFVDRHLATATEALLDEAGVVAGTRVLELAAGPGGAGLAAAERVGKEGRVVITDSAPAMVRVAARRAAGAAVETAVCEQEAIEFPDASFDAVISRHGLMFVEDPPAAVCEAARVLSGGGRFATLVWASRAQNPWLGLVLDAVGEQFGVPFPPPTVRGPFSLGDPDELAAVLRDGGLLDVRVRTLQTPMRAGSLEQWWQRVPSLAGPLATALEAMEPDVREQIERRALDSGRASARPGDDGGVVFDGAVLLASGTAP